MGFTSRMAGHARRCRRDPEVNELFAALTVTFIIVTFIIEGKVAVL
jgi:hypothetical protein